MHASTCYTLKMDKIVAAGQPLDTVNRQQEHPSATTATLLNQLDDAPPFTLQLPSLPAAWPGLKYSCRGLTRNLEPICQPRPTNLSRKPPNPAPPPFKKRKHEKHTRARCSTSRAQRVQQYCCSSSAHTAGYSSQKLLRGQIDGRKGVPLLLR